MSLSSNLFFVVPLRIIVVRLLLFVFFVVVVFIVAVNSGDGGCAAALAGGTGEDKKGRGVVEVTSSGMTHSCLSSHGKTLCEAYLKTWPEHRWRDDAYYL